MTRILVLPAFLLILLTGCDRKRGFEYDVNCPLVWPGNPTEVKLPYEQALNNGNFHLSIRPIADRTDAVQVVAKMSGGHEPQVVEWTQEGCGAKKIELNKGYAIYDFDFLDFFPSGDAVGEIKMRVIYRAKLGLR
jgi:hypothetical protein